MVQDLEVDRLTKRYGTQAAVTALSFSVARGSFFSILGPSGCGKTTLLRIVAGFLAPDEGDIRIGGRSMRGVAPNRRPVNMVFQHLALFPMMTVGQNVGYGLARRGTARAEIATRVAKRSTINAHQLETLMRQCEEAINGEQINWRQSLDLVRRLRELEKTLGLGMRARDERQAAENI